MPFITVSTWAKILENEVIKIITAIVLLFDFIFNIKVCKVYNQVILNKFVFKLLH